MRLFDRSFCGSACQSGIFYCPGDEIIVVRRVWISRTSSILSRPLSTPLRAQTPATHQEDTIMADMADNFEEKEEFTKATISIYRALSGWQTQVQCFFPETNTWDVVERGGGPYDTKEEAIRKGKAWAKDEGITFTEGDKS
jgi:hypothetical protein